MANSNVNGFLRDENGALVLSGSAQSSSGRGAVPAGTPEAPSVGYIEIPNFAYLQLPHGRQPDVQFAPDTRDELAILAEGGVLSSNIAAYFAPATSRGVLEVGPVRNTVRGAAGNGLAAWPSDGLLSRDEFTIVTWIVPVGSGLVTLGGSRIFWRIGNPNTYVQLEQVAGTFLKVGIYGDDRAPMAAAVLNSVVAQMGGLVDADVPADTRTSLTVHWEASTGLLELIVGDNAKSASSAPAINPAWLVRPFSGTPANAEGVALGTAVPSGAGDTTVKIDGPIIHRYRCSTAGQRYLPAPGVAIDAGAAGAAFPSSHVSAVVNYTGFSVDNTDTAPTIRDTQLDALQAAGCRMLRVGGFEGLCPPTSFAPLTIDFTALNAVYDRYASRNFDFHVWHGYNPPALRPGGGGFSSVPTSSANFAAWCVAISQHLRARYPGRVKSETLWNEPSQGGFWTGTKANYTALWTATAQAFQTAGLPPLGGPDEIYNLAETFAGSGYDYMRATIDAAAALAVPALGTLAFHDYTGSLNHVHRAIDDLKVYAASKGFAGASVRASEFNRLLGTNQTGNALWNAYNPMTGAEAAAWLYAAWLVMLAAGGVGGDVYRLGRDVLDFTSLPTSLLDDHDPPRATPLFAALALLSKHNGTGTTRITATSTWPDLRALATKDTGGRVVLSYGTFRRAAPQRRRCYQLGWDNLPATFTWKRWHYDASTTSDGRPVLVAAGDQTDLPGNIEMDGLSVGAIEITP